MVVDRGRNILSCGKDGTVKLWDVGQQSCLYSYEECGGIVNCCCIGVPHRGVDMGQSAGQTSK